jgi:SAM-dependent methyltransferase
VSARGGLPLRATLLAPHAERGSDRGRPESGWGRQADRRVAFWLFVLVTAFFLLVQEGAITGYDGRTMFGVTESLIERRSIAVDPELNTLPGRGGLEYSRYGLGLSLLAAGPYLLLRPVAQFAEEPGVFLEAATAATMAFVTGGLAVALYLLSRRLGARTTAATMVAVGGVAGTFALPYGKEFFSEPLATLALVVTVERLLARRPGWAGLALGMAVLTRPQNLLFAPVAAAVVWRTQGPRAVLGLAAGVLPGVVLTFAYNWLRFGDPTKLGYDDVGLTTPFLDGAAGLLGDPVKSVILFAPVVLVLPAAFVKCWKKNRPAALLIGAYVGITFVLTATWFAWHGGWSWGPRLLLPAVLLAVPMIGPWITTVTRTRVVALLFAAGCIISLPALVVSTQTQQLETTPVPPQTHYLETQPLASPAIERQFELIVPVTQYSIEHRYDGEDDGLNYLRFLSLWQFGAMRELGRAGLTVSLLGTTVLLLVIVSASRRLLVAVRASSTGVVTGREPAAPTGTENLEAMESAQNYQRFLVETIERVADGSAPVLDFGAGTGFHARALRARGFDVTCVEPHPTLRAQLSDDGIPTVPSIELCATEGFATVYSLNVLEHIENDGLVLNLIRDKVQPGGRLVLYVPAFDVLFSQMDRKVGHLRRYRRRPLEQLVRSAGFRMLHSEYVDSLGFVASLMYRLAGRDGEVSPRSVAVYDKLVFPVSRILDHVFRRSFGKNLLLVACRD